MKFALNASEDADWMELWCFRCEADHDATHVNEMGSHGGCPLLARRYLGEDLGEFVPTREDWWRTIPASVVCSAFRVCARCPDDSLDAERRGGETQREFHDRLRLEMVAELGPGREADL